MQGSKQIFGVVFCVCIILGFLTFFVFSQNSQKETLNSDSFLRIHIRANSNSSEDQNIKYKVKDEVVKVLTPLLSCAETKDQAMTIVGDNLKLIESTANRVLKYAGFKYESKASLKQEYFPTRTYESLTLESDVYDALILNLGSGQGDNWWCVAYPPMCFVGGESDDNAVVYKLKILEIIKKFFN